MSASESYEMLSVSDQTSYWSRKLCYPLFLCLVLFIGMLPLIKEYVLFHPDEQYYVDSGILMRESGDYLTPLTHRGELRFRKPIIPYWFVLSGYQLFGVTPLGARVFFAMGACLLVFLTWKTARLAFDSELAGLLAAVIAMCHPAVLISASRSMPDMCLAPFTVLSCYGFVGLIRTQQVRWKFLLAAYGGGALAVLSKGIPAAAFVVFSSAFLLYRERSLVMAGWRRFAVAIAGAVITSLSWFVCMWLKHGGELIDQFVGDQVGSGRFAGGSSQILVQIPLVIVLLGASFLPWLLPGWKGITRARRDIRELLGRSEVQLLIAWCCVYLALSSTINHVTMRYLLPIIPLVSIGLGGLFTKVTWSDLVRPFRIVLGIDLALVVLAASFFGLMYWSSTPLLASAVTGVSCLSAVAVWRRSRHWELPVSMVAIGCSIYGAIGLAGWSMYPLLIPSTADHIAAAVQESSDPRPLLLVAERYKNGVTQAVKLRVALRGQRKVILTTADQAGHRTGDYMAIVTDAVDSPLLSDEAWHRSRFPLGFGKIKPNDVLRAILSGRVCESINQVRTPCILATRSEEPSPLESPRVASEQPNFQDSSTIR